MGEPQAVDEVMQEVSLAAVRQQSPIRDPSKVAPWLYRLAVTQTLLHRRKAGRRRRLNDDYRADPSVGSAASQPVDPLRWLLCEERREMVRRAMREMPRREAEILQLKYTENWSYKQMAEHMGLSVSAVQARLHRARGRLRRLLAQQGLDSLEQ